MKKILTCSLFAVLLTTACKPPVEPTVFNVDATEFFVYESKENVGEYVIAKQIKLTSNHEWTANNSAEAYIDYTPMNGGGGTYNITVEIKPDFASAFTANPSQFPLTEGKGHKVGDLSFIAGDKSAEVITYYVPVIALYFDGNAEGVQNVPEPIKVWEPTSVLLPSITGMIHPEGVNCFGWSAKKEGGEMFTGKSVVLSATTTLFAIWEDIPQCTITYNANSGNFGEGVFTKGLSYNAGSDATLMEGSELTPATLVFDPHISRKFLGWSRIANDMNEKVTGPITITEDITLYALWSPSGTREDPVPISTNDELVGISNGLHSHYILTTNFEITEEWVPIGDNENPFKGSINGNKKRIMIFGEICNKECVGLFGVIDAPSGEIAVQDMKLSIGAGWGTVSMKGGSYAGGIVGNLISGTIQNAVVNGDEIVADGSAVYAGGIAGYVGVSGNIQNCKVFCNIKAIGSAAVRAGGIAGTSSGNIQNCHSGRTVSVTGSGTNGAAGGIVGISSGSIQNCYSTSDISASNGIAGGIAGSAGGIISHCVALNGKLESPNNSFRIVSFGGATKVNNYGSTEMSGAYIGGIGVEEYRGIDVSPSEYNDETWWTKPAGQGPGWSFGNGSSWIWSSSTNLPILLNAQ